MHQLGRQRAQLVVQARAPAGGDAVARLVDRAGPPPGAAAHEPGIAPLPARQDRDDGVVLAMPAQHQDDGVL